MFKTRLSERPPQSHDQIETVAMDGFTGFMTATTDELPDAVAVMGPFHVVRLPGRRRVKHNCRRRVQHGLHGHPGRSGDGLYSGRRTLHTGRNLLTDRQWARVAALMNSDDHVDLEVAWAAYQRLASAYRDPDRKAAKTTLADMIASLRAGVPIALTEPGHADKPLATAEVFVKLLGKSSSRVVCVHRPTLPTIVEMVRAATRSYTRGALPRKNPYLPAGGVLVAHVIDTDSGPRIAAIETHLLQVHP